MSAITNIKGCNYAFESFILLLNVLGLLWLAFLQCFECFAGCLNKLVAVIVVSLQPEFKINT